MLSNYKSLQTDEDEYLIYELGHLLRRHEANVSLNQSSPSFVRHVAIFCFFVYFGSGHPLSAWDWPQLEHMFCLAVTLFLPSTLSVALYLHLLWGTVFLVLLKKTHPHLYLVTTSNLKLIQDLWL
jgi:hypothetical protein